jgi:hypothetical protein
MGTSQLHAESAALIEAQIEGKNRLTDTGMYRVYTHPPSRIDMNRYQTWGIYIEDAAGNALDGVSLKVNADMPAHGHGLLSNPQIKPGSAPGRYRVEGLRFHMPGYWEIRLQMRYLGKQDGLVLPVELE